MAADDGSESSAEHLYYYRSAVLKISGISSHAFAIRQRSQRRFLCAYMLPIRDLCAAALFVLLSFVFYGKKIINNVAFRHRSDVYAARLVDLRNRSIALRERWCHRSTADKYLDGEPIDGATCVGRDPAFIQPVDPRVLY